MSDQPTYCESCQTDDVPCQPYPGLRDGDPARDLCEICAGTTVGNLTHYQRDPDLKEVLVAVVQVAHLLRKEIAAARADQGEG